MAISQVLIRRYEAEMREGVRTTDNDSGRLKHEGRIKSEQRLRETKNEEKSDREIQSNKRKGENPPTEDATWGKGTKKPMKKIRICCS